MNHFAQARQRASEFFLGDPARSQIERACLIWDLRGQLRVLVQLRRTADEQELRQMAMTGLARCAGIFWSGDLWIWSPSATEAQRHVYETAWKEATLDPRHTMAPEVRVLERHVSKAAWFRSEIQPPWPLKDEIPPILSFDSFKGGVGRTTALLSLAIQLARAGKRVAVIDLDLESPGISSALPPPENSTLDCGVVDYLLERPLASSGDEVDLSEYYYALDDPRVVKDGPALVVVPAGKLDGDYFEKLARLDFERLHGLTSTDPEQSPLTDLLKRLRAGKGIEYLLVDSRAGFHELGALALSGLSHLDILFGLENEQSWRGLEVVIRYLGRERITHQLSQRPCTVVFAMAPEPGEQRDAAAARFRETSYGVFSRDYYDEPDSQGDFPVPPMDANEQPHFPALVSFDPLLRRYSHVADVADRHCGGDYRAMAEHVLERIGRRIP